MATMSLSYGSNSSITMDLSGLASSSTFISGRESNQIDNTTNKFVDALVRGTVYVGTTPTVNTSINIYVWGWDQSIASPTLDALDGTDSAEGLTNTGVLYSTLKLAAVINVLATTSNQGYPVAPFSVAQQFGGVMPKFWGLYVAHNTGSSLYANSANTNAFNYHGIKYDVA